MCYEDSLYKHFFQIILLIYRAKEYDSFCQGLMLHISSFYEVPLYVYVSIYGLANTATKNLETSQKELWVLFRQVQCTAKIIIMVLERDSEVLMIMTWAMTIDLSITTL